jgi:hypothetical protein
MFGSPNHSRVLRGVEEGVAIAADINEPPVEQRAQFREHPLFTRRFLEMERGAAVARGIILPWGEASIPAAGRFGLIRVDPVEIGENGGD